MILAVRDDGHLAGEPFGLPRLLSQGFGNDHPVRRIYK
jgi:hypothetical protein